MQFIYVDESGDPGNLRCSMPRHLQPSRHFMLVGVVVPTAEWRASLETLISVRNSVLDPLGLPRRIELHAREILCPPDYSPLRSLRSKKVRIKLFRELLHRTARELPDLRIISACSVKIEPTHDAAAPRDYFRETWQALIEAFDSYVRALPTPELGLLFADDTNEPNVRSYLRRMRRLGRKSVTDYANSRLAGIIEDPILRASQHSYFVQLADLVAYSLYLHAWPKGSLRRYGADRLIEEIEPLLVRSQREVPGDHGDTQVSRGTIWI